MKLNGYYKTFNTNKEDIPTAKDWLGGICFVIFFFGLLALL